MTRRRLARLILKSNVQLLVILVQLCIAGCHSSHSRTIAVIPSTTGLELWEAEHVGAEQAAREAGYTIYWNAPTRVDDVARQVQLINNAVDDGDSAVVVSPTNYLALMSPLQQALEKHVPIVIVRSPVPMPDNSLLSFVLNDEEEMGQLAAQRIEQQLNGHGAVAVVGFDPRTLGIEMRATAFEAAMKRRFGEVEVLEERTVPLDFEQTRQRVEQLLREHPEIKAVFALDTTSTGASLVAIKTLNIQRRVILVGCDQELELMAAVRAGEIDSLIAEDTNRMGYEAVRLSTRPAMVGGGPKTIKIRPRLITIQNIDDADIQNILNTNWRLPR